MTGKIYINYIDIKELIISDDENITTIFINYSKIDHLYIGRFINNIFINNSIIKKITLGPNIYSAYLSDCKLEELDIYESLERIFILDIRNNKLTDIKIRLPYISYFYISGNPSIKFKYLDFLYNDPKEYDIYIDDEMYTKDEPSDYLNILFKTPENLQLYYNQTRKIQLYNKVFLLQEEYIEL